MSTVIAASSHRFSRALVSSEGEPASPPPPVPAPAPSAPQQAPQEAQTQQASESRTSSGTALKDAPQRTPPKLLPPFRVLLHNDDINEFGYVTRTVIELAALPPAKARLVTMEAHTQGVALLLVTHQERAELYREQFASKGLIVTIEPAE
ncbi:MAG: ATP-dependent Clp protease adaptor ClpS [Planctomycetota bacterium]|nr:ATP-dependent Clp protease adaptor ClpS [Planctomycetota bacterium]